MATCYVDAAARSESISGNQLVYEARSRHASTSSNGPPPCAKECSNLDRDMDPSISSWESKLAYLDSFKKKSSGALLISLADKLYNARAILLDLHKAGDQSEFWHRFNVPKGQTLAYYGCLVEAFGCAPSLDPRLRPLLDQLRDTILRIRSAHAKGRLPSPTRLPQR